MMTLEEARQRLNDAHAYLHIEDKQADLANLEEQIGSPDFWNDTDNAQQVSKQASDIRDVLERYEAACLLLEDIETASELAQEDPEFASEVESDLVSLKSMFDEFEIESWFGGRFDASDAILSIHPGSGGLEAQDWTEMLYRMYIRYADKKSWKVKVLDLVPGEGIGLDHVSMQIEGRNAYGMLRSESGVHRLVRISPTDEKKRRHTTFAAVEVIPVLPDNDITIEIDPSDVRVDVYRASGPGGQCVNTTDSAVRLTHIPTGIVVTCQNEKSQLQNKEAAFRVLRGRLYELEEKKRQEELAALKGEKMDNSFGSQIRNYVLYPYRLIKDTRSNIESGNVEAALDGDIDEFVVGYHRWKASL